MRTKTPMAKRLAVILCIIDLTLSWNINLSYKEFYFINEFSGRSTISIAAARTQLGVLISDSKSKQISSINTEKTQKNKGIQQKRIFLDLFLLLLFFVSLATVQEIIFKLECNKRYIARNMPTGKKEINASPQVISPLVSREGVK